MQVGLVLVMQVDGDRRRSMYGHAKWQAPVATGIYMQQVYIYIHMQQVYIVFLFVPLLIIFHL